ncbi:MAG: hypothetical protein HYT16_00395 [DPANN group archaeon]|nr:hypothetical protein [DPANN group archaeon]
MTLKALFGHPNNDYYLGNFSTELYEAIVLFEDYLKNTRIKFVFFRRIERWDLLSIKNFELAFISKAIGLMSAEKKENLEMLKHTDRAMTLLNEAIERSSEIKKGALTGIRARVYEFRSLLLRLNAVLLEQVRFLEHNKTLENFNAHKGELEQEIAREEQLIQQNRETARFLETASEGEARHVYARIMSEREFDQVKQTGQLIGPAAIPALRVDSEEQRGRLMHLRGKTRDEFLRRLGGTGMASVLVVFTTPRQPEAQLGTRSEYGTEVKFRGPVPINLVAIRR